MSTTWKTAQFALSPGATVKTRSSGSSNEHSAAAKGAAGRQNLNSGLRRHRATVETVSSYGSAAARASGGQRCLAAEAERQLHEQPYPSKATVYAEPVDPAQSTAPAADVVHPAGAPAPTAYYQGPHPGYAAAPPLSVAMPRVEGQAPHVHGPPIAYAQYGTPPPTPAVGYSLYPPSMAERLLQLPTLVEPFHQVAHPSCGFDERGVRPFETVVVNLRTREDRRQHMRSQLAATQLCATRFEAQTGADAPEWAVTTTWDSTLNSRFDDKTVPHPRLAMTRGERGCAMSHALLWAAVACRPDDAPPLLILEDDVELLTPTFGAEVAALVASVEATFAPKDREVVLYVGAHVPQWRSRRAFPVLPGRMLREADYAWQTSSYLIWPAAARTLLNAMPIDCPVDNYLSKFFLEHRIRALVVLPNLAAQSSPYRDGDILHSNVFKPVITVEPNLRRALEASQASIGETYGSHPGSAPLQALPEQYMELAPEQYIELAPEQYVQAAPQQYVQAAPVVVTMGAVAGYP
jgi:GR25 family glycosyltransferase involved in LPS biosynthesis